MKPSLLCLTVRFLDPVPMFHGRDEGGEPEWPPSPLRIFQALVAAAAARFRDGQFTDLATPAIDWLSKSVPVIVTPAIVDRRIPFRMYVPHNAGDLMTSGWDRGDTEASMAKHRIEKDVWPTRLICQDHELPAIHYLFELSAADSHIRPFEKVLSEAANSITYFGQGFDIVTAEMKVISSEIASKIAGVRWQPTAGGSSHLRVPREGTLAGLVRRHTSFLNRIGPDGFIPAPRLSEFNVVRYQSSSEPNERPCAIFELVKDDDTRFSYAQDKLVHLAGMVRHLAIELMKTSPPEGVPEDWVETYVAGHAKPSENDHRQFSYLPLPSIGHAHTDPAVRRVMIAAPVGDGRLLNHLARYLSGQRLKPTPKTQMKSPPTLVQIRGDGVSECYTKESNEWASVTPVILPGHDDHKPEKTRRLILKAIQQSGIDQPCEFQWSTFSHFAKSLSAYKYDRNKRRIGYIRPDHLLNLSAVHLTIQFENNRQIPGPLAIGAGRHCGLGIFARMQ